MKLQITKTSNGQMAKLELITHPFKIIYETSPPGGFFGYYGPDVCSYQSVAVRFTPQSAYQLKKLGLWFMNNGPANIPVVRISIRPDLNREGNSVPDDQVLEEWKFNVVAQGWNPVFEELDSVNSPHLEKGTPYWIVAESKDHCEKGGVWVMAGESLGFSTVTNDGIWQPGSEGAVPACVVWGVPPLP